MKKILALILALTSFLCCFTACDMFESRHGYDKSLKCVKGENYAVFTFDDFPDRETVSFELVRTNLGEGAIYYLVNLEEGALSIKYKDTGLVHQVQELDEFTADDEMSVNGFGGYVEGDKITIIFESFSPVSGEIILAFTEDALNAVHNHEHTGKWYMNEEIHFYEYTCGCENQDIAEVHLDGDGDGLCDICGYSIPEHEHTIEKDIFEHGHQWSYTCGCVTPPNFALHYDGNGDGKCDDCTYQMVEEGNHFIRNQAGAEWLREITADDIVEIKMISGGGGPLPPVSFTYISSSINKAVISSIFEEYYWLDSKPVPEEETQIADGGYVVVRFVLNDGTVKSLSFINGEFYHDGKDNYYELVRLPVFRDGTDFVNSYGFEVWEKYCQAYLIDGTSVCEIPVSEFEFTELTDDIYLGGTTPTRYIEMNGERLYFIEDCYFYIGDDRSVYYNLVGKSLDELIVEYSTEECNHQWDDGVEIEGGNGGYVMEYTCLLCESKKRETITIIPTENHFLRNQAGTTWMCDITANDIAKIKIISQDGMVAAGCLKYISSSENKDTIARMFERYYWLNMKPVDEEDTIVCDGGLITVCFIMNDGSVKRIAFNNGEFYTDADQNYFEVFDLPVFNDADKHKNYCAFETDTGKGAVKKVTDNNNFELICEIPMDEIEFEYDVDLDLPVLEPYDIIIETDFGDLEFIAPGIFFTPDGVACVLVGMDLNELIMKYSE